MTLTYSLSSCFVLHLHRHLCASLLSVCGNSGCLPAFYKTVCLASSLIPHCVKARSLWRAGTLFLVMYSPLQSERPQHSARTRRNMHTWKELEFLNALRSIVVYSEIKVMVPGYKRDRLYVCVVLYRKKHFK